MSEARPTPFPDVALRASYWGCVIFGGVTVACGILLYLFGSLLGFHFSARVALILGGPSLAVIHMLGLDQSPILKVLQVMNGIIFAGLVNAVLGALLFALCSSLFHLTKSLHSTPR